MKRFKKFIVPLVIILMGCCTFNLAWSDSGWDSSYDSGGGSSWDSGGSSSSWDSGGSGGSYSSGDPSGVIFFIILAILIIVIFSASPNNTNSSDSNDISDEELQKLLPGYTVSKLKDILYDKFVDVQNAWMNFDYDELKELCTDELYNSYKSQLEVLKIKNGKNVMHDFSRRYMAITNVKEENGMISVTVNLMVSFYDYVIDQKTAAVTRGKDNVKITNNYVMTFVKGKDSSVDKTCPSCGAPVEGNTSITCDYCGSKLVFKSSDFVLSKKSIK